MTRTYRDHTNTYKDTCNTYRFTCITGGLPYNTCICCSRYCGLKKLDIQVSQDQTTPASSHGIQVYPQASTQATSNNLQPLGVLPASNLILRQAESEGDKVRRLFDEKIKRIVDECWECVMQELHEFDGVVELFNEQGIPCRCQTRFPLSKFFLR